MMHARSYRVGHSYTLMVQVEETMIVEETCLAFRYAPARELEQQVALNSCQRRDLF